MSNTIIRKIAVDPNEMHISDIRRFAHKSFFFGMFPTHYACKIWLSPLVVQRLIQWSVTNHYIELDGTLSIKIRNRKEYYYGTSKEKVYEKKSRSSR